MRKLYETINKSNYKLRKVIWIPEKEQKIENNDSYYYNLKENDINNNKSQSDRNKLAL